MLDSQDGAASELNSPWLGPGAYNLFRLICIILARNLLEIDEFVPCRA